METLGDIGSFLVDMAWELFSKLFWCVGPVLGILAYHHFGAAGLLAALLALIVYGSIFILDMTWIGRHQRFWEPATYVMGAIAITLALSAVSTFIVGGLQAYGVKLGL